MQLFSIEIIAKKAVLHLVTHHLHKNSFHYFSLQPPVWHTLFSFNCVFFFLNDLFRAFRCTGIYRQKPSRANVQQCRKSFHSLRSPAHRASCLWQNCQNCSAASGRQMPRRRDRSAMRPGSGDVRGKTFSKKVPIHKTSPCEHSMCAGARHLF